MERRDYLHFLPFAACVLYLSPYYLSSAHYKLDYMVAEYHHPSLGYRYYVRSLLLLVQFAIYLSLVVSMVVRYSRELRLKGEARSTPAERAVLFQVRFMGVGFLILFIVGVLRYTLDQTARTNLLVPLGASALIYALGYLGLRRPEVLTGGEVGAHAAVDSEAGAGDEHLPAKKYEKSTLTPERAERYLTRLLRHMETEKPYIDGELTLPKLAERLSIPASFKPTICRPSSAARGRIICDSPSAWFSEGKKGRVSLIRRTSTRQGGGAERRAGKPESAAQVFAATRGKPRLRLD